MRVEYEIDTNTVLTAVEKAQIDFASKRPIEPDEENPILSLEQLKRFKRVHSKHDCRA